MYVERRYMGRCVQLNSMQAEIENQIMINISAQSASIFRNYDNF